jgi:hypothetical protein
MTADSQPPGIRAEHNESPSLQDKPASVHTNRIVAPLWSAILNQVPLGYEDETGFHLETGGALK